MLKRISWFREIKHPDNKAVILTNINKTAKIPMSFERIGKSFCGEVSDDDITEWIKNGYQVKDYSKEVKNETLGLFNDV